MWRFISINIKVCHQKDILFSSKIQNIISSKKEKKWFIWFDVIIFFYYYIIMEYHQKNKSIYWVLFSHYVLAMRDHNLFFWWLDFIVYMWDMWRCKVLILRVFCLGHTNQIVFSFFSYYSSLLSFFFLSFYVSIVKKKKKKICRYLSYIILCDIKQI